MYPCQRRTDHANFIVKHFIRSKFRLWKFFEVSRLVSGSLLPFSFLRPRSVRSYVNNFPCLIDKQKKIAESGVVLKKDVSALKSASVDALQKLRYDWMQETHVFSPTYRKTIDAEVTDHFRYTFKRFTELTEYVSIQFLVSLYPHVHESASTPKTLEKYKINKKIIKKSLNLRKLKR